MSRRWRWRVELGLALVSAVLVVVSVVWPTWFEQLLDASPDGGDGSAERWFALVWVAATVLFSWLARRDHRRLAGRPA
ncbi:hypothetical protein GCM10027446_07610 [Angustibacter peucedani]